MQKIHVCGLYLGLIEITIMSYFYSLIAVHIPSLGCISMQGTMQVVLNTLNNTLHAKIKMPPRINYLDRHFKNQDKKKKLLSNTKFHLMLIQHKQLPSLTVSIFLYFDVLSIITFSHNNLFFFYNKIGFLVLFY